MGVFHMNRTIEHKSRLLIDTPFTGKCSWYPPLVVFIACMTIYMFTLAPTVTGEDSGELIAAAYGKGVAHPPGYPLWTMLAALAIKIIPLGSVAYRANLLSALLASASAAVLCQILRRFFSIRAVVAVLGSICFACGRHLWSQAVIAEVYTLHVLLATLVIYIALIWRQSNENRYLYIIAFLVGLALSNHHLAVLLGPLLVLFVLVQQPRVFVSPKVVISCLVFLALGLLPYIYLPLAARQAPYMNWGSPDNWQSFLDHVFRRQYADDSMHAARSLHRMLGHLGIFWDWNCQQYSIAGIPLILAGIVFLARKNRAMLYITGGFFLMHSVVLSEILNFPFQRQDLFCTRVFMLPGYIITAIWLCVGCQHVGEEIQTFIRTRGLNKLICYFPMIALTSVVILTNYSQNNMRHYYYAADHADNILDFLEKDAIIIPSGDHNTFPVIYRHYVEGVRPDVIIADKYGYIEYDLYSSMPNAPKRISTRQQREEIEAHLIRSSQRPVYYTVKPRLDLLPEYRAVSYGMLFRICKADQELTFDELPRYDYRNLNDADSATDHAATVILSDYHFHLASNALRQNQVELAMNHIDQAATLSEGLKEEMNNLGTLLAEFGLNEQAQWFYEEAARLGSNYLTPRWNLAYILKAEGQIVRAIQVFNDLANLEPEDYRIFGELGFLLYQHGDIELAIEKWGKSLSLNPDQPQIIEALAGIELITEKPI